MNEIIKIGKTTFLKEKFVSIVSSAKSFPDIAEKLGLNKTVTTHLNNIKIVCEQEGINTSHLKIWKSENYCTPMKQYSLCEDNQAYFDAFETNEAVKESSKSAYRSGIGMFLESLKRTDCADITVDVVENYIINKEGSEATKINAQAHVMALLRYIIKNDVNGAKERVSRDLLVYLI
jgi:hypothetical protein